MRYKNKWNIAVTHRQMAENETACEIASELGITLPTAQLLVNRGCMTPDGAKSYLGKEEEQIHDPFLMTDMDKAVSHIMTAVENGDKIVIFGDYDVDGVTSVSILYLYLEKRGADISYYIPCRSGEGYGLSKNAIKKFADEGYGLIVTVDTGITAVDEAAYAAELGVDMVITDHHECHSDIPAACAVVNPKRPDCTYPFKELAGVGVVFKLLCAMESEFNPGETMIECTRNISREYADLVAIGTIADVMPISDENRLIVSYGLSLIEDTDRPGLIELIDATRSESKYNTKKKITASFIGYTVAPRINAAGRVRDASIAVDLFLAKDCETASPIAKTLCDINHERQEEENKIVEEAYAQITETHDFESDPVIVLDNDTWHHGIIGIVASRITEKYNCPSILISFKDSDDGTTGKGSGRSIKGLNLAETLGKCSDLLEKYGGHELAAGLTIKKENLEEFKKRINEYARDSLCNVSQETQLDAECELVPEDITMGQANELYCLEPYGVSNPMPVFVIYGVVLYDTALVGGGKHTRLTFKIGDNYVGAMCFRQNLSELDIYPGDIVDVMFTLDVNEFRNQKNLQLIVKDVRLDENALRDECAERELYEKICGGATQNELQLADDKIAAVVPTHEDFAAVYNVLKRELRVEHEIFSMRALTHLMRSANMNIGYVKMKYILSTFNEMNILSSDLLDAERETYAFRYVLQNGKKDLDNSNIYRKLKSDFGQR